MRSSADSRTWKPKSMAHPGREPPLRAAPGVPRRFSTLRTPEIPPPPKLPSGTDPPSSRKHHSKIVQYGAAAAAIIAALGGIEFVKVLVARPTASAEQAEDIRADVKLIRDGIEKDRAMRKQWEDRQARRDQIVAEGLCKLNGGKPIARGAPCNELVWDPPPLDSAVPWRAREEWPP